ncbi:hypothetical protein LEP1GSC058_1340 [Leptospira fainei serovar Hurstbridge str. BUT 6]|uniref:Uncharacterized protein n=1 Tax=Leptospira fainei serovar Hurstbridge str. BUT 6 TaxID=1193011 RepID=S3V0T1_9LEPT|nr:hypothetical protein [Leptospira fainei]EPG76296.1 hypothetical protein LEP1GSC058_1340 [Leptospira fainei serovar Hurstbridge str. BUT 6]
MASLLNDPEFPKLIRAYRSSLRRRYSPENIKRYPRFSSISSAKVELLVKYFLELLYPELEGRKRLDGAFSSLAGFVQSPSKVFGVLGSLGTAVFKLGRHLKSAFQAGFAALHSYVTAHKFEDLMFTKAKELLGEGADLEKPEIFDYVLASVSPHDADSFRNDIVKLFRTLSNRELLSKIRDLMDAVVRTMKAKPKLYSQEDVSGILLGAGILARGEELFQGMSRGEMDLILDAIETIEKDSYYEALERIKFSRK